MSHVESVETFDCRGETLVGILSLPDAPRNTGVLIAVGGPQYRAGSHRQFTLLARTLADAGYPTLRFDYRGMGDSTGDPTGFENTAPDIGAAIDALLRAAPAVDRVVLWGLCDAASAALLYLDETRDARVGGLCLLNPWVRSEATLARTHVKHYYGQRLMSADFWKKLLTGGIDLRRAIGEAAGKARSAAARDVDDHAGEGPRPYQRRMAQALARFSGPALFILSGRDLTANEFRDTAAADRAWRDAVDRPGVETVNLAGADHTFSTRAWRDEVAKRCIAWLHQTAPTAGRTTTRAPS